MSIKREQVKVPQSAWYGCSTARTGAMRVEAKALVGMATLLLRLESERRVRLLSKHRFSFPLLSFGRRKINMAW